MAPQNRTNRPLPGAAAAPTASPGGTRSASGATATATPADGRGGVISMPCAAATGRRQWSSSPWIALAALLLVFATACGTQGASEGGDVALTPGADGGAEEGGDMGGSGDDGGAQRAGDDLSGTFGGDANLEGGCAWLDAGGTRYEVLWPEGYSVSFAPDATLTGPDGAVVATAGDTLTVEGARAEGMASICQVGILFQATAVTAG